MKNETNAELIAELKAAREDVGLYNASHWGQFLATGPDAAAFLHRMLSNEVKNLKIREGRYQGLLDRKGMTLSLFYLLRTAQEEFLGITPPQLTEKTITFLDKMKFIEKLTIRDVTKERDLFFFVGPNAESFLQDIPQEKEVTSWWDTAFNISCLSVSGPKEKISPWIDSLQNRIVLLSEPSFRLIKMSSGFPEYGIDIDDSHILLETSNPVAYQRNKGCYPGQEVIEKIATYGKGRAPKRLCHFDLPEENLLPEGTKIVTPQGNQAGYVTSSLFDPLDQVTRIFACLENKFSEEVLADVRQCQFLPPTGA